MSKVAIIGAGSIVFTKQFLNDMFNTPCMAGSTYALMGPTMWKLEKMKEYADQLIRKNGIDATVAECRRMVQEMFEAEAEWLPQFAGKRLKDVPDVHVPADTIPAAVPEDPALAIDNRFGKLAQ